MNAREVKLHGGPMHGKVMTIPEGWTVIRVMGMDPRKVQQFTSGESLPDEASLSIEGSYSQVSGPGNQNNFEWDGFRK